MAVGSKIKYPRREALRMLAVLEQQIENLKVFEGETEYSVGALSSDRYAQFRAKSGEVYTLSIVVKSRVDHLDSGPDKDLNQRFDLAIVGAQRIIIQASLKFMEVLSKLEALPLGAREIFTGELRSLYDARERLRDPRLAPFIDETLGKRIDTAEAVLNTIIEKAPQLMSFGGH
ncbi:MAG: hypothetical protein JO128_22355 [Alphaproteobacteria bacterium]|nr:hypothetical protein [Alphaproteobacteria bacterium]